MSLDYEIKKEYLENFIDCVTESYEVKPNFPGFKIQSSQPCYEGKGQSWVLVKESLYDLYRELDLHFDIKSIALAKDRLSKIDGEIENLKHDKKFLSMLLNKDPNIIGPLKTVDIKDWVDDMWETRLER